MQNPRFSKEERLQFENGCAIMTAKSSHYGSRFAAQKARAAFRLKTKTSGNPMDISWYNDCKKQSLRFPLCRPKSRAAFHLKVKTSGNPTVVFSWYRKSVNGHFPVRKLTVKGGSIHESRPLRPKVFFITPWERWGCGCFCPFAVKAGFPFLWKGGRL